MKFLKFGFPDGYESLVPTPATDNHPSALNHTSDVVSYIAMEVKDGAMLGPFEQTPFTPLCQVNALLRRPKKDSHLWKVILDLSWPHPPAISVNGYACALSLGPHTDDQERGS